MNIPSRDNHSTPLHSQTRPVRARGGVARSRYSEWKPDEEEGMLPWSERRKDLFDWAERNLPDQHPALVVVAIIAIRMGGERPTKERVFQRLKATNREASQIGYANE